MYDQIGQSVNQKEFWSCDYFIQCIVRTLLQIYFFIIFFLLYLLAIREGTRYIYPYKLMSWLFFLAVSVRVHWPHLSLCHQRSSASSNVVVVDCEVVMVWLRDTDVFLEIRDAYGSIRPWLLSHIACADRSATNLCQWFCFRFIANNKSRKRL